MISLSVNTSTLRKVLYVGCVLMTIFAMIDLRILPEILHTDYLISRFGLQIPPILALVAYSYHKTFKDNQQMATLLSIVIITYSNYWLIQQSWIKAEFAFSYEGTLLYTFFAFFVLRINFKFGLMYVVISLIGFAALVTMYPVYGTYNSVNLGFVAMAQFICLYGLYTLSGSLHRVEELTDKLEELSRIDQLSGLFNRRAYEQDGMLLLENARRLKLSLCIFMIDIDNFKDYNDSYGHQKGDEAIKMQADILKRIFKRQSDIIGRFGGEEFIVITSNMSNHDSQKMAQKILDAWSEERMPHGQGAGGEYLTCSIGITNTVPKRKSTLKKLIGQADDALYEAKSGGRNQFQQFKPA